MPRVSSVSNASSSGDRIRYHARMTFQSTNPTGASALVESEEHIAIDVRTVEEFDLGHVPGAYNVPFVFRTAFGMEPNPEFSAALGRHFEKDAKLVFV
jgi:rhodanese-related sulfurtransferase